MGLRGLFGPRLYFRKRHVPPGLADAAARPASASPSPAGAGGLHLSRRTTEDGVRNGGCGPMGRGQGPKTCLGDNQDITEEDFEEIWQGQCVPVLVLLFHQSVYSVKFEREGSSVAEASFCNRGQKQRPQRMNPPRQGLLEATKASRKRILARTRRILR